MPRVFSGKTEWKKHTWWIFGSVKNRTEAGDQTLEINIDTQDFHTTRSWIDREVNAAGRVERALALEPGISGLNPHSSSNRPDDLLTICVPDYHWGKHHVPWKTVQTVRALAFKSPEIYTHNKK